MKKFIIVIAIILVGGSLWLLLSDRIQFTEEIQSDPPGENEDGDQESVSAIEWNESEITSQSGTVLVHVDDLPGSIEVSEEASFGASGEIDRAVLSPDHE